MIFTKRNLYGGIADILHFALCCFTKVPLLSKIIFYLKNYLLLEAPAETIGSLINQHGRKDRCSLSSASLSSEVQIAWNGPAEYDCITAELIEQALKDYFEEHSQSGKARFFVSSNLKLTSSTVAKFMKKRSRINFDG